MSAPTWTLSGFGDEIDPDPTIQVAVLQALGAGYIEVRSAWGTNIIDLGDEQLTRLADILHQREMRVSAIASPVGKVDVTLPIDHELTRLGRAIAAAHTLDTHYVRIFSFYRTADQSAAQIRDDVLVRMSALAATPFS